MDPVSLYLLGIVFAATLIRSTFGFGEALFAVPLLALVLPLRVVTPLVVLLSVTIAAGVVAQDWRHVHVRGSLGLLLPSLAGIPCGLWLLASPYQSGVKLALALLIIGFAVYGLLGRKPPHLKDDRLPWLLGCGFCAGALGAAYGMNGPPLVVYATMRRWSAQQFRATLQGYFLPASVLALIGYRLSGLWVPEVTHYYLICLPVAIPAIVLGRWINRRMHPQGFVRYIYAGLVAIGLVLLAQALR
ncbi:MAG: sulfite exporter TauE/SafE family protein [Betaproteobacteria bacterium]|nr:sulfite exporter TauE/SafE family protein [Betaproteobacteria bacterium]